ncbi:hypothetical protein ACH4KO_37890 [Streptomyces anulatus]
MSTSQRLAATVMVSPRSVVVDDGVKITRDHLYLTSPLALQTIAPRAVRAWKAIRGAAPHGVEGEGLRAVVQDALGAHRIQPSQVFDDLSADRIRR